jgi:protein-disulfide isomerase
MMQRRTLLTTMALTAMPNFGQTQSIMEIMRESPMGDKVQGLLNAPVTIVEYASLTCHHCLNFHLKTYPELKKKYIDSGKVKLIYREFPLNSLATAAAMLARCAPDNQFFAMTDALFKTKETWGHSKNPAEALFLIAQQAGFSKENFDACLSNQKLLDGMNASQKQGESLGVNATPTFFINGKKYAGFMTIEEMDKAIEPLLAGK